MVLPVDSINASVLIVGDRLDKPTVTGGFFRGAIGTGLIVGVPSGRIPDLTYRYVVTAHHLVEDELDIEVRAPDPTVSGTFHEAVQVTDWRQPTPNLDLAVAPFPAPYPLMGIGLAANVLPPDYLPPLAGTIFYTGYFEPLNRLMTRSGSIGALNETGLPLAPYSYAAHLVDCRSYEGFSGSPCFALAEFATLERTELPVPMGRPGREYGELLAITMFCGMFTAHIDTQGERDAVSRLGVGVMLPSLEIWKALMSDESKRERDAWDEQNVRPEDDRPHPQFERLQILDRKLRQFS